VLCSSAGAGLSATRRANYATMAHDAATGSRLWVATYEARGTNELVPSFGVSPGQDLGASPDGSTVFVTGDSFRSPQTGRINVELQLGAASSLVATCAGRRDVQPTRRRRGPLPARSRCTAVVQPCRRLIVLQV
jgi:hypothetical protein